MDLLGKCPRSPQRVVINRAADPKGACVHLTKVRQVEPEDYMCHGVNP